MPLGLLSSKTEEEQEAEVEEEAEEDGGGEAGMTPKMKSRCKNNKKAACCTAVEIEIGLVKYIGKMKSKISKKQHARFELMIRHVLQDNIYLSLAQQTLR